MTTFLYVGAGPGLQGWEVVQDICLNRIFKVAGRATLTGPGGSMKYQLGYLNGNTETDPFPVKTRRNAIQALASSCVALAPANCGPTLS